MSRSNHVFKSMEEALEYATSAQCDIDLLALPPDVDELTDEDDIDDNALNFPVVNDVVGHVEVQVAHESDAEESDEDDIPLSTLKTRLLTRRISTGGITQSAAWKKQFPTYNLPPVQDTAEDNFQRMKNILQHSTPLEIFEHFFNDELYTHIMEETNRYASNQKNRHGFAIENIDLKIFIGFLIFSGYHTLPSERDYWSEAEDLGIPIVKNAMSRNAYTDLKSLIHFQDNMKAGENKQDKSFKISPIIKILNKNFRQWNIFSKYLAIDEMIVRYYGHHPIKQFIKSKPIRFGYKLWALCADNGYCYNFALYCGKDTSQSGPLGTKVVKSMLSVVNDPPSHIIYFDNFFTSHSLLCDLKNMGFRATGTIRENRTAKCTVMSAKDMDKKERGFSDYRFDTSNDIMVLRWKDNKSVSLGTNFDVMEPFVNVQRWCREKKEKVAVPQPLVVNNYNKYMGGVDHHDWLLEKHSIAIRGKKWYWCLFTRMIDMAIVNSCILYWQINGTQSISIKEFRRQVAVTYLKLGHGRRVFKGRPLSFPTTSKSQSFDDVRYDNLGHILTKRENQRRCQFEKCKGKPRTFCVKCGVTLCISCFPKYHNKTFK